MRILLLEDDRLLGQTLQSWLQMDGYAVDWLQRGGQAAAALAAHDHHCVLLDRDLPGLDGDAVLRALRGCGALLPMILITARDTLAERVQGLDLGADDYLVKPFGQPRHIVSRAQLEEALYGWSEEVESNAIEMHIYNLRRKFGHGFITAVRHQGYGLAPA